MKTTNLFCASPASTAICSSTDQRSPRPIHRHNHHLHDRRKTRATVPPCSSRPPFEPKAHYQSSRKISTSKQSEVRRKSSADVLDLTIPSGTSSRYLLSDTQPLSSKLLSNLSDEHVSSSLIPSQVLRPKHYSNDYQVISKFSSTGSNYCPAALTSLPTPSSVSPVLTSTSNRSRPCNQVVELRVSIHCKGCEGKVRKHISRMEGVTWFSIDLATKKLTVVGDVTPLGVLESVSRVKNAEFWPSPTSSSASSSTPLIGMNY